MTKKITLMIVIMIVFLVNYNNIYNFFLSYKSLDINKLLNIKNSNKIVHQDNYINYFNKNGGIVIDNILSDNDCDELNKIISSKEKKLKETREKLDITGELWAKYRRVDVILPIEITEKYVKKIYLKLKHFCDTICPEPKLIEISAFVTYPGCYPQPWHTDHEYIENKDNKEPSNIVTFGIALDKVTQDMGPLELYAGSNNIWKQSKEHRNSLYKKYNINMDDSTGNDYVDGLKTQALEELCKKMDLKKMSLTSDKGSLVAWSNRACHRGGGNILKRRPVFYFSLSGKGYIPDYTTYFLKRYDNLTYISYTPEMDCDEDSDEDE
tara:strand:+ start:81 stop:1052 length:972 start_codon:yes stop_codon:yes gene_type:complete